MKPFVRQFKRLVSTPHPGLLAGALALTLVEVGAELWFPILTRDLVDQLSAHDLQRRTLILLTVVLVVMAVVGAGARYLLAKVGHGVTARLQRRLAAHVLGQPMRFFDSWTTGELVSRMVNDCTRIAELISEHLINVLSGLLLLTGSAIVLWWLDTKLTLVLFGVVAAAFAISLPILHKTEGIARTQQDRLASASSLLTQILSEMRMVKAHVAEEREIQRSGDFIDEVAKLGVRAARVRVALEPIVGLAITVALLAILGYGGVRVMRGELSIGTLTAFIVYIFNVATPIAQISGFMSAYQAAKGATGRLLEILDSPKEDLLAGRQAIGDDGLLAFRQVSFAYGGTDVPVLHEVDLEFRPGETTAIVGASGSGKSTILALIERFYEPTSGSIVYGEYAIDTLSLKSWRERIAYVAQSAPVMRGTLYDNLVYGMNGRVSEEEVVAAVEAADLSDFVRAHPQGLKTVIHQSGTNVSGGQRQRIAIARVLLRDPEILILDEATSALDSETEDRVQLALQQLTRECVCIVVAHRLSTVVHADKIYVLENGMVTGVGTHSQLIRTHPYYARLVKRQFQEPPAAQELVIDLPRSR